jgi:hypothetical protein
MGSGLSAQRTSLPTRKAGECASSICGTGSRPTPHWSRRRSAASKIGAILRAGFGLNAFPVYGCGAAQCWPLGRGQCSTMPSGKPERSSGRLSHTASMLIVLYNHVGTNRLDVVAIAITTEVLLMPQRKQPRAHDRGYDLISDYPYTSDELRIDVGRSNYGSFVRLVHLPTGRACIQAGLFGERLAEVEHKLLALLFADIPFEAQEIHIDHGKSSNGLFIRIRHLPSGCSRSQNDIPPCEHAEVERRLLHELYADVAAANESQHHITA